MVNEEKLSSVLCEFARTMITDFPIQRILDRLVDRIVEVLPITSAGVTLISHGSTPHYIAASNGAARRFELLQNELGEGPCVEAFQSGQPVSCTDLAGDGRFPTFSAAAVDAGLRAVFTFPLFHGTERFGALDLYRETVGELDADDMAAAQTLADVAAALLLNARSRDEALATSDRFHHNAMHDALTGLPNRVLLNERIEHAAVRARRTHSFTAVLFLDLDRFKRINDTHGHHVGDQLLCAVAQRLSTLVRHGDTLARVSGDEFVFLCEELAELEDVNILVARINDTFLQPFELASGDVAVAASVGIAYVGIGQDITADLLRRADLDMYRAKRDKASVPDTGEVVQVGKPAIKRSEQRLEDEVREALTTGQLKLAYQPIIQTTDGAVAGVEALLRWTHPQNGPIAAPVIVAAAERSDLIGGVGTWILEQACSDRATWNGDDSSTTIDLAVNVSVHQLSIPGFCDTVTAVLERTGMEATSLVLELTESITMEHNSGVIKVLESLSGLGVRLALDDFGTGYSALSYLGQLPVDIVKLDRSLVTKLDQPAGRIVAAGITDMAHQLGMQVVAEGVETETHRHDAATIGCDYTQGYLHARPMWAADIQELLAGASRN